MSNVPKFVRQRLGQEAERDHPDVNLLSAFAEGALSKGERAQVLAHLSVCAACRETVALALPEVPVTLPAPAESGARWARWPTLRWAGVAATVVVVAAAVMVEHARRPAPAQYTRAESVAAPVEPKQPEVAREAKAAPAAKNRALDKRSPMLAAKTPAPAKAEIAQRKYKKDAAVERADSGVMAAPQANRVAQIDEAARAQRVPAEMAAAPEAQVQSAPMPAAAADVAALDSAKQRQIVVSPHVGGATQSADVAAQSEVVSAQQAAKSQKQNPIAMNEAVGGFVLASPMAPAAYTTGTLRWRLSAEGTIERSLDAGHTWQRVAIAGAGARFRSLATLENNLWAGGSGGALYHSSDHGQSWKRVPVKAGDVALEADITRVEFTDAQHGALMTTSGETWTTTDGGTSWSLARR